MPTQDHISAAVFLVLERKEFKRDKCARQHAQLSKSLTNRMTKGSNFSQWSFESLSFLLSFGGWRQERLRETNWAFWATNPTHPHHQTAKWIHHNKLQSTHNSEKDTQTCFWADCLNVNTFGQEFALVWTGEEMLLRHWSVREGSSVVFRWLPNDYYKCPWPTFSTVHKKRSFTPFSILQ